MEAFTVLSLLWNFIQTRRLRNDEVGGLFFEFEAVPDRVELHTKAKPGRSSTLLPKFHTLPQERRVDYQGRLRDVLRILVSNRRARRTCCSPYLARAVMAAWT